MTGHRNTFYGFGNDDSPYWKRDKQPDPWPTFQEALDMVGDWEVTGLRQIIDWVPEIIEDGFGSGAEQCSPTCDMQVVRPGDIRCSCHNQEEETP